MRALSQVQLPEFKSALSQLLLILIFCCQEFLFFSEAFRPVLPVSDVACWMGEVLNCCLGVGQYVTHAQCRLPPLLIYSEHGQGVI